MRWIGKVLGAFFGFLFLGPLGAIIGLIVGHFFDKGLQQNFIGFGGNSQVRTTFFDATFSIMGHIAKADGRVSEREIQLARMMMQRLGLQGERKHQAMRQFNQGKQPSFNLDAALDQLRQQCAYPHLLQLFIELQVQIAYADGPPQASVKHTLQHISQRLGLGNIDFSHVEAMLYGQWRQQSYQYQQHTARPQSSQSRLDEAYRILEIDENASAGDIKKAYRRKMNENHPDKLIAKGLPKEMIDLATQKTQQIKAAYEHLKKIRRF